MNRTRFLICIMLLLLVACAPSPAPSAIAPNATSIPTSTVMWTPTPASTVTPHSLPTPTATATLVPSSTVRPKTSAADEWLGKDTEREKLFNEYAQTIKDGQVISELGFKRLGTTWEKELERSRKRFLEADTKSDVYYALLSLQRTFHDAHSSLTVPSGLVPSASPAMSLPFTLAVHGDKLENARYEVVTSQVAELKPGMILKEYGPKSIKQLEYEYLEWLDSSSPEKLKIELAKALTSHTGSGSRYPLPDANTPVTVVFIDPSNQKEIKIDVSWRRSGSELPSKEYDNFTIDYTGINYRVYKDAASQTLVLVYASFSYNTIRDADLKSRLPQSSLQVPPFDSATPLEGQADWILKFLQANAYSQIDQYKQQSPQARPPFSALLERVDTQNLGRYLNQQAYLNLLVDVRENTGGNVNADLVALFAKERFKIGMREFIYVPLANRDSAFFQDALSLGDSTMRKIITDQLARDKDAAKSPLFPFFCRTSSCTPSEATYDANPNIKKFNFAVLSGPTCVSSCDQFVSFVQDNQMGRVVGLPSRGGSAPFRAKKEMTLRNGDKFGMVFSASVNYRPNGEPLEGNPAQVSYYLFPEPDYVNKMIQHLKTAGVFK